MTTILRGMTWEHARGYDCMVAASLEYRNIRPDVEIHWQFRSLQAFADAPIDQLAANFDLLVIDHPHIPLAAELGVFAQLDGHGFDDELRVLSQQSVGRSYESYSHNGHQYGLASDAAAQVAAYRPDLLTDPPRNWDAVLELAREGKVLWPSKPIDSYSSLVTIAAGLGNVAGEREGHFLDDEHTLEALERMHVLAELVPANNLSENPIEVADALSTSDQWLYSPLLFGYTNYSRAGFRPNRLRYIDIPESKMGVGGSLLGGAGIAVSATASDVQAARAFALWVSSAEVQRGVYYDGGGQPGNAVAWDDERLNEDSLDFFKNTRATLDSAYLRPRYAGYIEFQDRVSPWVTDALNGELSDQKLAQQLNAAARELLVKDAK